MGDADETAETGVCVYPVARSSLIAWYGEEMGVVVRDRLGRRRRGGGETIDCLGDMEWDCSG